jgi:serine-type D-Ala-D-Ala carboxypeptidase
MTATRSFELDSVAELVVRKLGAAPAAVCAAVRGERWGVGVSGTVGQHPAMAETPFDLASITKSFVAVTAARLARQKALTLAEPLVEFLPELAHTPSARVPLDLFLAHRAGLEAHQRLFESAVEGRPISLAQGLVQAAQGRRKECLDSTCPPDGFPPVYSDMGFLLVGQALARRAGIELATLVRREVLTPLGIEDTVGSAAELASRMPHFADVVAPTEVVPWRGGVVRGIVHDENAMVLSGLGLSGHAGLFGDALSVMRFGEALLNAISADDGWLGPNDLKPLLRPRPGGSLLAGFDSRSEEKPSSGSRVSRATFGHLGFTGTSLWIDPKQAFVGVLLTNRVHPTRDHVAIREARPAAYDAMFDALAPTS